LPIGETGLLNSIRKKGTTAMASNNPWRHMRSAGVADDIDFDQGTGRIVEIELDPGESAVAEAGAFVWEGRLDRDDDRFRRWQVKVVGSQDQGSGFMGKLLGAGKRLLTGCSPRCSPIPAKARRAWRPLTPASCR
jgi:hypothetical protein